MPSKQKEPSPLPKRSIRVCADRGGTFCDIHASYPDPENLEGERKEIILKLLSKDPSYEDAPTEGIRRLLNILLPQYKENELKRGEKIPTEYIDTIRLSTTVATNALLERKGRKCVVLVSEGMKDVLLIGNQSRPSIFALNIQRPPPLYDAVEEVEERVTLEGYTSDPKFEETRIVFDENGKAEGVEGEVVKGLSGEAVRVLRKPDKEKVVTLLRSLRSKGYTSLAIALTHSYTFPEHEHFIASLASDPSNFPSSDGPFDHISVSSTLLPQIKLVERGTSAVVDAYLTPVLKEYLDGFFKGFEGAGGVDVDKMESQKDEESGDGGLNVEFMSSSGGLVSLAHFSGLKSILSGPAGGVVGFARTSWNEHATPAKGKEWWESEGGRVIGIDIGGTSTDVSLFTGSYTFSPSSTTAGITISTPQLDINTVAAGGGSCLTWKGGLMRAGPESGGAVPGPACYRKGGPLALTDANLLLGRLVPKFFPKIFGPNEDQGLDYSASEKGFLELVSTINKDLGGEKERGVDEVVYGFIKVANETMCRPIRALTEARGYATSSHILASFGGAGGQHAVEIARLLGIRTILIHRYSSVLSAYGLALADRTYELQEPCSVSFSSLEGAVSELEGRLDRLEGEVRRELEKQGFEERRGNVEVVRECNMRFEGTDTSLMVSLGEGEAWKEKFKKMYKEEFGFLLEGEVVCDDVKVRGMGKSYSNLGPTIWSELSSLHFTPVNSSKIDLHQSVYFEGVGRVETPVYLLETLEIGDEVRGPAMVVDGTQTVLLDGGCRGLVCRRHLVLRLDTENET